MVRKPKNLLRRTWTQLGRVLDPQSATAVYLTPSERSDLEQLLSERVLQEGIAFVLASIAGLLLGLVAVFILAPEPLRSILMATLLTTALVLGIWVLPPVRRRIRHLYAAIFASQIAYVGFSAAMTTYFRADYRIGFAIVVASVYITVGIMTIILCPGRLRHGAVLAVEHIVIGGLAWRLGTDTGTQNWMVVLLVNDLYALAFFQLRMGRMVDQARTEIVARQLVAQNERLRVQAIERDLEIAAKLQDALPPWSDAASAIGATIQFFQLRQGPLGGDWMAARTLADGSVAIAVADVTGKGLAAAMVVQAVQSLWVDALAEPLFNVKTWLQRVNRTLVTLGQRQPYTLTIGVLLLTETGLRYFAAGHVPAFLIQGRPEEPEFRPVNARGGLLGIGPEVTVGEAKVDYGGIRPLGILLGTDGVFTTGGRVHRQALAALLRDLNQRGPAALEACRSHDDKLLVWVNFNAA